MTRIAVVGASGFVGRSLLATLTASGHHATAVTRRPMPSVPGVTHVVALLDDRAILAAAFEGHDAVINAAGRVHVMQERAADPLAAFREVNVAGALSVYEAARTAGVPRLVQVSSVKVHGEGGSAPLVESSPLQPGDAYARSKVEAEQALKEAEVASSTVVIIRPPLVTGPGSGANLTRLWDLARRAGRYPLPLAGIDNRRSLVSVRNLGSALEFLALHSGVRGEFLVADGPGISTTELIRLMARAQGHEARLFSVPRALLRSAARIAGFGAEAKRLLGSLTVDDSRLRALGWAPVETTAESLSLMGNP